MSFNLYFVCHVIRRPLLSCKPDFVVGTPSRAYQHIISGTIKLTSSLKYLVIDEADLLFSYGYKDDMKKLIPLLSNTKQTFLMSATLSEVICATNLYKFIRSCYHFELAALGCMILAL